MNIWPALALWLRRIVFCRRGRHRSYELIHDDMVVVMRCADCGHADLPIFKSTIRALRDIRVNEMPLGIRQLRAEMAAE